MNELAAIEPDINETESQDYKKKQLPSVIVEGTV